MGERTIHGVGVIIAEGMSTSQIDVAYTLHVVESSNFHRGGWYKGSLNKVDPSYLDDIWKARSPIMLQLDSNSARQVEIQTGSFQPSENIDIDWRKPIQKNDTI